MKTRNAALLVLILALISALCISVRKLSLAERRLAAVESNKHININSVSDQSPMKQHGPRPIDLLQNKEILNALRHVRLPGSTTSAPETVGDNHIDARHLITVIP